jgi:hypothetical protein
MSRAFVAERQKSWTISSTAKKIWISVAGSSREERRWFCHLLASCIGISVSRRGGQASHCLYYWSSAMTSSDVRVPKFKSAYGYSFKPPEFRQCKIAINVTHSRLCIFHIPRMSKFESFAYVMVHRVLQLASHQHRTTLKIFLWSL